MDISRANEGYTGCGSVVEMSWHRAGWVKGLCQILYDGFHGRGMQSKDVSCG
uniref:Uncharacterized protein n=1 Tax=Oryza sativa subsp. japonica TaxID=39947 RepID=Q7XI05_ORYSJ|nr:hypothetical protein [Oryza sativa Japonica Group]